MALLNSFSSGVSAVKTFGKSLEVIGDNIANVNTTGFKSARVLNKDAFAETLQKSTTGGDGANSQNAMQVGYGTGVSSITKKFTQGALTTTAGPADLGISGKGFFKVQNLNGDNQTYFTRAGDFRVDDEGFLVTTEGYNVLDVGDQPIKISEDMSIVQSYKIDKDGKILTYISGQNEPTQAGQIQLTAFTNPNALERVGGNLLANTGDVAGQQPIPANQTVYGEIIQGTLELSNVDLTQEFSDLIVAQRSFQAGSRVITVSDSVMEEVVNLKR